MIPSPVTLDVSDGIAWLTLTQPDTRNAVSPDLANALAAAANLCADDPAVRCVVLTGSGRFFSVGGDIDLFARAGDGAQAAIFDLARSFHVGVHRLATMPKPLVVAVNGPAAGAGLSLAIIGDIVIAAASAHFTAAYSAIGLTPDGGLTWSLPRLIGLRRAQEMILTNRRVDSAEAAAIGLVTRVVPDEELNAAAREAAGILAMGATNALGGCRMLLHQSDLATLAAQLDTEAATLAAACGGSEGREGIAAFLSKRRPNFAS